MPLLSPAFKFVRSTGRCEPSCNGGLFHHRGKSLIERGIARNVEHLVRQFVKHRARKLCIAPAEHRVQNRVGKMTERRIGGHSSDRYIVTPRRSPAGVPAGSALGEVAAINHTT